MSVASGAAGFRFIQDAADPPPAQDVTGGGGTIANALGAVPLAGAPGCGASSHGDRQARGKR